MISDYLKFAFLKHFRFKPEPGQEELFEKIGQFILEKDYDACFLIKGFAGTGKTSSVSAIVKALQELKINTVLLAPTGRAAKVFSHYSGQRSYTIHKKIYRQKSSQDGMGSFVLDRNLHRDTIFFVDEASMIPDSNPENTIFGTGRLLDDLVEFVYTGNNCKLVLIGDTAQLPPVGLELSPALEREVLMAYNLNLSVVMLEKVVRQSAKSGILKNATQIRSMLDGDLKAREIPKFFTGRNDVLRIKGEDLIEAISEAYDKYGIENVIIINRSNKQANRYNQGIRNSILGRESEIAPGDFLMVVKNNYYWGAKVPGLEFIANGDIARIKKVLAYQDLYGFRFADLIITFPDYDDIELEVKVILDTLSVDAPSLTLEESKKQYLSVSDDYIDLRSKKERLLKLREDPYFNALQVKFSYAITCHKAQGGQWKVVFIDQGYISDEMMGREYLRWLYTAFTRTVERIYLVNFPDKYFD